VKEALEQWSAATGLTLKELPPADPRLGPSLADVEIRWDTPEENEQLRGQDGTEILGLASMSFDEPHWMRYTIILIRENLPAFLTDHYTNEYAWQRIVLHELGHAAGLGHVSSETDQVMSYAGYYDRFQRGDLSGLAHLSSFRQCQPKRL